MCAMLNRDVRVLSPQTFGVWRCRLLSFLASQISSWEWHLALRRYYVIVDTRYVRFPSDVAELPGFYEELGLSHNAHIMHPRQNNRKLPRQKCHWIAISISICTMRMCRAVCDSQTTPQRRVHLIAASSESRSQRDRRTKPMASHPFHNSIIILKLVSDYLLASLRGIIELDEIRSASIS